MSLKPVSRTHVPDSTAHLLERLCPDGHPFITLREELGSIFTDEQFAHLYSHEGRPVVSPATLALVCILQYMEGLTDRQAAQAVQMRIDWKYLLGLELDDPGFDETLLCDFRQRLVDQQAEHLPFDLLLQACTQRGLLKSGGKQRSDATHVLAAIRTLERLEQVGETLRTALNHLARADRAWLRAHVPAVWADQYGERFDRLRLPKEQTKRDALAVTIGADGFALLDALDAPDCPAGLSGMPAIATLRTIWAQQYERTSVRVHWRATSELPAKAAHIVSPYEPDARYGKKRTTEWTGYHVHLTETCNDDAPHLITNVQTVTATTKDILVTDTIQQELVAAGLPPDEHYADSGYVAAAQLVASTERGISLIGPAKLDTTAQARAGAGFALTDFHIDWARQVATCPQGEHSVRWNHQPTEVQISFAQQTCAACPVREHCTTATTSGRILRPLHQAQHEALQARRAEQQTTSFRTKYQRRAGIEGTIAQGTRGFDLRYARYWGLAKTRLQHLFVALAINLVRLMAWLGSPPDAAPVRTRQPITLVRALRAEAVVP
jgi:transposase